MEPFEEEVRSQGYRVIAGVDEAGRGPLAGPVVAAAVVLSSAGILQGIDDSKRLSAEQRKKIYPLILKQGAAVGVGIIGVKDIDRLNILQASLKAMELAVENLQLSPDFLLIDGIHSINLPLAQRAIPKGDQRCQSIAAASIVAKVTRDRLMLGYHKEYPQYNFARHKGYGTKEHLQAILQHGCCPIHRQSFKPIYQLSRL
ncbi:MAG: ribonuclease HII [Thermodesulfobacteriota bacterium]|nr:ribonuclease HII [Thermodesulfobacteriota bacterium]